MSSTRFGAVLLLASLELTLPSAAQDCQHWNNRTSGPSAVESQVFVFDSRRKVPVLFQDTGRTWEWTGTEWSLRATSGPPTNGLYAGAFDSLRGRLVLFASFPADDPTQMETWEWDGNLWQRRVAASNPSQPVPRFGTAMAFDELRGVSVLFGGERRATGGFVLSDETWHWNGTNWLLRSIFGGPARRAYHAMAYDPSRQAVVISGGETSGGPDLDDTWEWNGTTWTLVASTPGNSLSRFAMAYDLLHGRLVRQGGVTSSGDPLVATTAFDGSSWVPLSSFQTRPGPGHSMAFDAVSSRILEVAGSEFWALNGANWVHLAGGPPTGLLERMTYDSLRNRPVLITSDDDPIEGTEVFERVNGAWEFIPGGLLPRQATAVAFDSVRGVVVAVGPPREPPATVPEEDFCTWEWNGTRWSAVTSTGCPALRDIAVAFDSQRGVTVLFGCNPNTNVPNETWEYDGTVWSVREWGNSPQRRRGHAIAYDSSRGVVVLFGGRPDSGSVLSDTWEYDGVAWTQRTPATIPPARFGHNLEFDSIRNRVVLFGGLDQNSANLGDSWVWDGTDWALAAASGPPPRFNAASTFDAHNDEMIVFGGAFLANWYTAIPYGDTWGFGPPRPGPAQPYAYASCPGFCYATKNRYLSFTPPANPNEATNVALRVTFTQMPGPSDCPGVSDFSAAAGLVKWVGEEVLSGTAPTGVYRLQDAPLYRDWSTLSGGVLHVSDCNIVPCATYTIEAVADTSACGVQLSAVSAPVAISTTARWGDVVGPFDPDRLAYHPADGVVSFTDVSAIVKSFQGGATAPPRSWCDLDGNRPSQGNLVGVNFQDISAAVAAFKGAPYPFAQPGAPCAAIP